MPKHNVSIRLDDEEREWLEAEAKKDNRTMANLVRRILSEYRKAQSTPF